MDAYKLDSLHYYTAPGLSWDALLKSTQIDLELLTDLDMHLFIEKGMRGGIWYPKDTLKQIIYTSPIIIPMKTTTT